MMVSPSMVQVGLVAFLAVLLVHHLQLRQRYEKLKVSCGEGRLDSGGQSSPSVPGRSGQHTIRGGRNVFVMLSSSKGVDEGTGAGGMAHQAYAEDYEPTIDNKDSDEDVVVMSSADGVAFQTNDEVNLETEEKTVAEERDAPIMEGMVSTYSDDVRLHPSQSSSLFLTTRHDLEDGQEDKTGGQSLTLSVSVKRMEPSATNTEKLVYSPDGEHDSEIKGVENPAVPPVENLSTAHRAESESPVLSSSESTKEGEKLVLKTSLEEIVPDDANADHIHYRTQESTSVFNTGYFSKSIDLLTRVTDFVEVDLEGSCDSFDCMMGDEYEDEQEYLLVSEDEDIPNVEISENPTESLESLIKTLGSDDTDQFVKEGTSAWCVGDDPMTCRFQNICYNTQERDFVFFRGENSVLEIDHSRTGDGIFDINLSTIQGHNTQMFSVVTLSAQDFDKFSVGVVQQRAIAISRFKPDNIMHVLHDDVLPLFQTLSDLKFPRQENGFDVAIIFTDAYERGSYFNLYSSLSSFVPIMPWKFNQTYDLLCFPEIQIGLQTSTVWYQYGFFQPQGPVTSLQNNVLENIHKATKYLSSQFHSDCLFCNKGNHLVFLSRKDNRLILNEGELIMSLAKSTRLKVLSVSLETHSLSEIVTAIRQSRGVLGMHGSLLSLAIFLPPGTVLVELFPFAVNPSRYTPFKSFCDFPGSGIIYKSWVNPWRNKSVVHPDRAASEGGIRHLPIEHQDTIAAQTEVPEHLCCDDPSWLYHIYQDTFVNIDDVVSLVVEAIHEAENIRGSKRFLPSVTVDIPGSVRNLLCEKDVSFDPISNGGLYIVSWDRPWVSRYDASSKDHKFELVIQEENSEGSSSLFLPSSQLSYRLSSKTEGITSVNVWVRVVSANGGKGQNRFVKCLK